MREDMKAVIADTFTEMLDKEDIDKITVTKLIGECHISRQTFYYHFKDIMDVLDWAFRRATEELVKKLVIFYPHKPYHNLKVMKKVTLEMKYLQTV